MKKYLWLVPFLLGCVAFVFAFIGIKYFIYLSPLLLFIAFILNLFILKGEGKKFNFGCLIGITVLVVIFIIGWVTVLFLLFWIFGSGDLHPED